jgi:hypothetical protein
VVPWRVSNAWPIAVLRGSGTVAGVAGVSMPGGGWVVAVLETELPPAAEPVVEAVERKVPAQVAARLMGLIGS